MHVLEIRVVGLPDGTANYVHSVVYAHVRRSISAYQLKTFAVGGEVTVIITDRTGIVEADPAQLAQALLLMTLCALSAEMLSQVDWVDVNLVGFTLHPSLPDTERIEIGAAIQPKLQLARAVSA
ncbi:MAG: hypothetical protein RI947_1430 [Candidatus Parcubacteria bacterium]|jgi:hypothetical protein